MEEKNELGNIYGSRISQNGKWLNLLIVTHINGKEERITCPVRIADVCEDKPRAEIGEGSQRFAAIYGIKVFEDKKPNEEAAKAEDGGIPF